MRMVEFDPVVYSQAEAAFLKANLGKPPHLAIREAGPEVSQDQVLPILQAVYELEIEKANWCGVPRLVQALETWEAQSARWKADRKRGAPRWPSMFSYDSRGRAFPSGPGADIGQVRTYFDPTGKRVKFSVLLQGEHNPEWKPDWVTGEELSGLIVDSANRRIECGICGHTEHYNPDSRSSFNVARGRMSKHLRSAKEEVERHRELHTAEFGQKR